VNKMIHSINFQRGNLPNVPNYNYRGLLFICILFFADLRNAFAQDYPLCSQLQIGQFTCGQLEKVGNTDSVLGCQPNGTIIVSCWSEEGVICGGPRNFTQVQNCLYTNGYDFSTTLTLSLFLGNFGIDRFYLGYPTIGLFKLFTFGGFLIGNWIDIILIATQTLKPADGSNYVMKINGPRVSRYVVNDKTYQVPQVTPYSG